MYGCVRERLAENEPATTIELAVTCRGFMVEVTHGGQRQRTLTIEKRRS